MAVESGSRLGPYVIESAAGAGGMGEVYKAKDTRLERTVAIKVLPSGTAQNADLRMRFEREARAISSLNHPHICTLYDIGAENGFDYLVMEYLEGETLSERLKRGPLTTEELFQYGAQIADALDKAHRQGLVHRDLKPANVMITKTGAKLLDFGLAKLTVGNGGMEGVSHITQTTPLTGTGTILGTVQYMSPEQLEGKEADSRSDIFAFGAMVYEMATGQKAFSGQSQASLIAAILEREPRPISELQPMTPPALERLVKKCLAKDPDARWQSARDLGDELRWIIQSGSQAGISVAVSARRRFRFRLAWVVATVAILAALILGYRQFSHTTPEAKVRRYSITGGPQITEMSWPMISPDGKLLAMRARDSLGSQMIWIRPMNSLTAYPLPGTENAGRPFWSPDSRYLAYFSGNQLKKIPASGGPAQLICEVAGADGCWGSSGVIIFDYMTNDSIRQVSASGGVPTAATTINRDRGEIYHAWPWFLPDGEHFLYLAQNDTTASSIGNYMAKIGSLDGKTDKELFRVNSRIEYAPPGYLLYSVGGVLMARRFDAGKLDVIGEPIPIAENVAAVAQRSYFSVSNDGTLIYQVGSQVTKSRLVWVDRTGKELGDIGEPGPYEDFSLSPDGTRLAYQRNDLESNTSDIWILDLRRGVPTRLTFDAANDIFPQWSPDGSMIAFSSSRNGNYQIFERQANGLGDAKLVAAAPSGQLFLSDWCRDGRTMLATHFGNTDDIWALYRGDSTSYSRFETPNHRELRARISPDGKFIAYQSDESGHGEIYVRDIGQTGGKWQISSDNGYAPIWRPDGREIYYNNGSSDFIAVPIKTAGDNFEAGIPQKLFNLRFYTGGFRQRRYDVSADGQKFIFNVAQGESSHSEMVVVLNWQEDLTGD